MFHGNENGYAIVYAVGFAQKQLYFCDFITAYGFEQKLAWFVFEKASEIDIDL